jgi:hypothetical protein
VWRVVWVLWVGVGSWELLILRRGKVEGRVPSSMTSAVGSEDSKFIFKPNSGRWVKYLQRYWGSGAEFQVHPALPRPLKCCRLNLLNVRSRILRFSLVGFKEQKKRGYTKKVKSGRLGTQRRCLSTFEDT